MVKTRQQIQSEQEMLVGKPRSNILKSVLDGKTIDEAYQIFRKEIGKNSMDYVEFDYWYYRFYNGNHDLDLDRDFEGQSITFSNLPIHIITLFGEQLEPFDRLIFRKASQAIAAAVDDLPITCKKLRFANYEENAALYMDNRMLISCYQYHYCQAEYHGKKEEIKGGNALQIVLNDLFVILKNPYLRLEKLIFEFTPRMDTEKRREQFKKHTALVGSTLKELNRQISIQEINFYINRHDMALAILPYLEPGTLKAITFASNTSEGHEAKLDELLKLDQWKKAETTSGCLSGKDIKVPIEQPFLFTRYGGSWEAFTREDLITIRDVFLRTTNTQHCDFRLTNINFTEEYHRFVDEVEIVFESSIGAARPPPGNYKYTFWRQYSFIHNVPDTDRVFKIEIKRENFIITRNFE